MAYQISLECRNAAADAVGGESDADTPPSTIEFRTGSPPANVTDPDSGTLLVTLTASNPAFGSPVAGVITANAFTPGTVVANGTVGHFREKTGGAGTVVGQGTAGAAGGSPDFVFDNEVLAIGGSVSITSMTKTMPES